MFNIDTRTIRRMVERYELPLPMRLASRNWWRVGSVRNWLNSRAEKSEKAAKSYAEKIDAFHALRTSYINLLYASGADPKTVQELARHDTAAMTLNVYGRANIDRMTAAGAVGEMLVKEKNAQHGWVSTINKTATAS